MPDMKEAMRPVRPTPNKPNRIGNASSPAGGSCASERRPLGAAHPAATSAPERTKSRREKVPFLNMRRPAFLVLAAPHLHRFRVALDPSIFRVEMQFTVHCPRDVGKLQHRNRYIADRDRSVEFLALTNSRNEVREVSVGHGIAADQVGR